MTLSMTQTTALFKGIYQHLPCRKQLKRLVTASILSLAMMPPLTYADDLNILFEQALYSEQTAGDLAETKTFFNILLGFVAT